MQAVADGGRADLAGGGVAGRAAAAVQGRAAANVRVTVYEGWGYGVGVWGFE